MDMASDEPVLLHEQDLMLALLRSAAERPAAPGDALERLERLREQAGEPPIGDRDEIETRLREATLALTVARALEAGEDGMLRITQSGRDLLARHQDGIDMTVLMELEPFRAAMEAKAVGPGRDPRPSAYATGHRAFIDGRRYAENPFPGDTVDHLLWQNGWSEARDERALP
jgi:ribosome modulation factor